MADLVDQILTGTGDGFDEMANCVTELPTGNPTIARLLVRAIVESDSQPDRVALDWRSRFVSYGRRPSGKAGEKPAVDLLTVQIGLYPQHALPLLLGIPLLESLIGKPVTNERTIALQKTDADLHRHAAGDGRARRESSLRGQRHGAGHGDQALAM